jgi:hypothetical protein
VKVFLSHSTSDQWIAKQIAVHIKEIGCEVFLDVNDLQTGDVFDEALRSELQSSDDVLILLSSKAVASSWVLLEIGAAWALQKRIVPIVHGIGVNELPAPVDKRHARDLNEIDAYYAELSERIASPRPTDDGPGSVIVRNEPDPLGPIERRRPEVCPTPGDTVLIIGARPRTIMRPGGKLIDFSDGMARYLGVVAKVTRMDGVDASVSLDVDGGQHWWAAEWLTALRPNAYGADDVAVGTRVRHAFFGEGTVTGVGTRQADDETLTTINVEFDQAGDRSLGQPFDLETSPFVILQE